MGRLSKSCGVSYPVGNGMQRVFIFSKALEEYFDENEVLPTTDRHIAIWCRGSSGLILGTLLAAILEKKEYTSTICFVRKESEMGHSSNCDYQYPPNSYHVVIDDFICTGTTIREIESVYTNYRNENDKYEPFDLAIVTDTSRIHKYIECKDYISS